jgi:quercetin dioxygenase-like cupin family protein
MQQQAIATDRQACGAPLNVMGVQITVLASREQTGSHEVTLQEGPEDAGPPPHSHGWDESFYVLRGSIDCLVGDRQVLGSAGSFIHVPAGTVHAFRFGADGGTLLEIAGAGASATAMFRRLNRDIPPGPPDLPKVVGILREHGVAVAV